MKRNQKKNLPHQPDSQPVPPGPDISNGGSGLYPADKTSPGWSGPTDELEESLKGCVRYPILKDEVEAGYITRLIHDLKPTLNNPLFAAGPGKVIFEVEGYDIKPRHLALMPEFRAFIQKAEKLHPCWFYFTWPYSEWPNLVTLACSTQITIKNVDHKTLQFGIDRDELGEFLLAQVHALVSHCAATGIPEEAATNHLDQLFQRWFPDYITEEEND